MIVGSVSGGGYVAGVSVAAKVGEHMMKVSPVAQNTLIVLLVPPSSHLSLSLPPHSPSLCPQSINPKVKIIAAEPKNADDLARSFAAGERLSNLSPPNTVADALKSVLLSIYSRASK